MRAYKRHLTDEEKQGILIGDITIEEASKGVAYLGNVQGRHAVEKTLDPEAYWLRELITCWEDEPDSVERKMRWQVIFDFSNTGRNDDWDRLNSSSHTEKDHSSGRTSFNTYGRTHNLKLKSVEFTLKVREAEAALDLRSAIEQSRADFMARVEMMTADPADPADPAVPFLAVRGLNLVRRSAWVGRGQSLSS